MTTTVVRDSIVGDKWIEQVAYDVPMQWVIDEKTGQPNGDILTGPVRLAFDNLFTLPQATATAQNPKYGATLLFTPFADMGIMYDAYYDLCAQQFPEYWDEREQDYLGLHSPFHDQRDKAAKYGGFTPGCIYLNATSKFKPPVVDSRMNAIIDPAKVYPGVWAICSVNVYGYGKNPPQPKKGAAFGLQNVMIIGDDTKFGGGAADPTKTFKGVNVRAPIVRPDGLRGGNAPTANAGQPPQAGAYRPAPGGARPGGLPGRAVGGRPPVTQDDDDYSFMN